MGNYFKLIVPLMILCAQTYRTDLPRGMWSIVEGNVIIDNSILMPRARLYGYIKYRIFNPGRRGKAREGNVTIDNGIPIQFVVRLLCA